VSELEIPQRAHTEAVETLYEARKDKRTSVGDAADLTVRAAAPIIVAAKLRALELRLACREDRALVLAEADELDPPVVGA
jgi:hypothetical protein